MNFYQLAIFLLTSVASIAAADVETKTVTVTVTVPIPIVASKPSHHGAVNEIRAIVQNIADARPTCAVNKRDVDEELSNTPPGGAQVARILGLVLLTYLLSVCLTFVRYIWRKDTLDFQYEEWKKRRMLYKAGLEVMFQEMYRQELEEQANAGL